MTSLRQDLDPREDDNHTYPTLMPHGGIRECTGSERRRLKARLMNPEERMFLLFQGLEERITYLEGHLRKAGLM